jgi:sialidase-1
MLVHAVRKSDGERCDLMLQSVPTGNGRSEVSIFYKEMEYGADGVNEYTPTTFAQVWTKGMQVSDCGSAYSTMTLQRDGRVAFLYEEEPGWYNIVYAPLSIEAITGGVYALDVKRKKR